MANTQITTDDAPLTQDWLYQEIMLHIEPELLLSDEELEAKYKEETSAGFKERLLRYQKAYNRYNEVAEGLKKGLHNDIVTKRKEKRLVTIKEDVKKDEQALDQLSQQIEQS
jgi:hypothetical protein